MKNRLILAKEFAEYSPEKWLQVIFSDESSFRLCGASGNQKVWRENGTRFDKNNIIKTEKFDGGSIMAWGYITADGPSDLVFIDGNMNQNKYKAILEEHLLTFLRIKGEKNLFSNRTGRHATRQK